ncbi:transglutaminase domain-containing protein [Flavilitoribacter nigricans]|uniref:Transglutaminase-like domain-containing protein n=1 Tax=Flavilitoribacter nigricans (strain ATCC 23147 / DSM 23189 / NBRC 102662 / NCIMB 1420 / SS-2) TaxID=1122177 RepID=A0A2D0N7P7_FLAN2|nr:transglutaminase domain-containing protein [Flavilitoribacter nigricans]PHN04410.1 hypothetical protein CRP01_20590 [Flavilitoribacter nigricans DSM 23189 = NBRC 102662]
MHFTSRKLLLCIGLAFTVLIPLGAQDWASDFSAIDQRARKSPRQLESNLPELTAYLCEGTTGELEKIRAIYVWITTHIGYDWKAIEQDKRINHFIRDILERKVALCFGYAQLFKKMCDEAGITGEIVNGYAKGTTITELPIEEPNHSWNAVRIKDEWYLLDATWGSSTLSKQNDFVQITNDDYFLIRPDQFVRTHLPGNPMWQLLSRPVSAREFMGSDALPDPAIDTSFMFRDTIERYFSLSLPRRKLYNQEMTYHFYPTRENSEQLGHALIDYAGTLSDTLEGVDPDSGWQTMAVLQEEIIRHCHRARSLVSLYPWQQELFVGALINQAVLLYNHQEEEDTDIITTDDLIVGLLEEAQDILANGPDSYFNRMARQQCTSYLAVIKENAR